MPVTAMSELTGGLRTDIGPRDIPDNCSPDLSNVWFRSGNIDVRPGRSLYSNAPHEPITYRVSGAGDTTANGVYTPTGFTYGGKPEYKLIASETVTFYLRWNVNYDGWLILKYATSYGNTEIYRRYSSSPEGVYTFFNNEHTVSDEGDTRGARPAPTVVAVEDDMQVSGAGWGAANGRYVASDPYNGQPTYVFGEFYLRYLDTDLWTLQGPGAGSYYANVQHLTTVEGQYTVTWGTAPAPTVSEVSTVEDNSDYYLGEYHNKNLTPDTRVFARVGTKLYVTTNNSATFDGTEATIDVTLPVGVPVHMYQFKGFMYLVAAGMPVGKWDPEHGYRSLADLNAPAVAPVVTLNNLSASIADCRNALSDGSGPTVVVPEHWNTSILEPFDNDETCGTNIRRIVNKDFTYKNSESAVAIEILGRDSDGISATGWMYQHIEVLTDSGYVPRDLTPADSIKLRFRVHSGGAGDGGGPTNPTGITTMKLMLGGPDFPGSTSGELEWSAEVDVEGLSPEYGEWIERTIYLDEVPPELKAAVGYIGIWFTWNIAPLDRIDAVDTLWGWDALKIPEDPPGLLNPYLGRRAGTILFDRIWVDVSDPDIIPGEYNLVSVYGYDTVDGLQLSPTSEVSVLTVPDQYTTGLKVTVTKDADSTAKYLYLYLRGGTTTYYRRIGTVDLTSEPSTLEVYDIEWDGIILSDADVLDQYIRFAMSGASLLCEYKTRMIYINQWPYSDESNGSYDTLHISNWDDADRVPKEVLWITSTTYGGFIRVGGDGMSITGLAPFGSYLVIFKERSVYLFAGDTPPFEVRQISNSHGCIAGNTVAQVDGNQLLWLDENHVWAWDGQNFVDVGKPITKILESIGLSRQRKAFAVYDQANRAYLLFLPTLSGYGNATVLVFDCMLGVWTKWDSMPNGFAARLYRVSAPGIYTIDCGVSNNVITRLFAGTSDARCGGTSPISWYWKSKSSIMPYPLQYKDVDRVGVAYMLNRAASAGDNTLRGDLYINEDTSVDDFATLSPAPTGPDKVQVVEWYPVPVADCESWQVKLSGVSSAQFSINRIDVNVLPTGEVE